MPNVDNSSQLPDDSFSNSTIDWEITYRELIGVGNMPVSSYYRNLTFWSDPAATLLRSNDTHNVKVDFGEINRLNLRQEEYFFDWDSLAANTIVSQDFDYQLVVPSEFDDQQSSEFLSLKQLIQLLKMQPHKMLIL